MKECFLITSYCDTREKSDILASTIASLRKYNIDICIHAHYPVDESIQKSVEHYLFDATNPIIPLGTRSIIMWRQLLTHQLNVLKHDYGYTVASQVKYGSLYLHDIGYDIIHVINYDTILTDSLFSKVREGIKTHDGVLFMQKDEITLLMMSYHVAKYLEALESVSMKDYVSMNEYWYAEKYFFDKFKGNNLYLNDKIDSKIRHQPHEFERYDREGYSFHCGEKILWVNGDKKYTNEFEFFFYNIKKTIHLKLMLDGEVHMQKLIIDSDPVFISTDISMSEIYERYVGQYVDGVFIPKDHGFELYINGKLIDQETVNTFCLTAIEHDLLKKN